MNGVERPDADMNRNYAELPVGSSLEFDFGEERALGTLRLVFDPDFTRESVSPNAKMRVFAQRTNRGLDFEPMKVAKTLVRAFTVECDGKVVYSTDKCHNSCPYTARQIRAQSQRQIRQHMGRRQGTSLLCGHQLTRQQKTLDKTPKTAYNHLVKL